jgi:predicted kinase
VIDNTSPTKTERQVYIAAAKAVGYRVVGYYFQSNVEDCKRRNEERSSEHRVPLPGLLGTYARLELPSHDEGFDALYYVKTNDGYFAVEEWRHEV